jgi:hypothetical protein
LVLGVVQGRELVFEPPEGDRPVLGVIDTALFFEIIEAFGGPPCLDRDDVCNLSSRSNRDAVLFEVATDSIEKVFVADLLWGHSSM